jgi:NAD(P)-dependent dehydrogenase (short-subunit alcohol dehydrogenase family)
MSAGAAEATVRRMSTVAVVTGASTGLGAGMVEAFTAAGLRVAACARRPPGVGDLRASVDITDHEALGAFCATVAQELGPIDLWVNNAGVIEPIEPVVDADPAAFAENVRINVAGTFNGIRTYVRHRRDHGGGGVLVNVSSGVATYPVAGWGAYCASKAAGDMLTQVVRLEAEATGLRVYAVAPGMVDTPMQEQIRATPEHRMPEVGRFIEAKEEGRFNEPRWVAENILAIARGELVVDWRYRVPPEDPNP